ncbi:hypothetical protein MMC10_000652 [Thelotrema lepadinum]|nr:hypothetical protein [Thelotrema lepadinum]
MPLSYILVLSGLSAFFGYLFLRNQRYRANQYTHGCSPPKQYPHKDFTGLGIDLFLDTGKMYEEHQFLPTWYRRYKENGTTFEVSTLGTPSFRSCEPANIQSVFITNAKTWGVSYRLPALGPYCGPAFLTTDGQAWEHSRALLAPAFQKSSISDHTDFAHYLDLMLAKIPRNGESVDLQRLAFSLYLDTATLWLFGESFESLSGKGDKADTFIHTFAYSLGTGGFRMAIGPLQFLHRSRKWAESNRTNQAFIEQYVDRAIERQSKSNTEKDSKKRPAVLDLMVQQLHDRTQLRNEATHAFIAAQETTACLISNLFWTLARHPSIWARLRSEALDALGPSPTNLDFEAPLKLKYLRNVINETLRLYPVFPYHLRVALADTTIPAGGGADGKQPVFCPAGSLFDGNFAVLHRQQSIWGADAEVFRPERWDEFRPKQSEFMPFGGGPRACAGRQKALMETSYFVVRMLLEFERLDAHDEREWQGEVQITAKNLHGCHVGFTAAG